MTENATAQTTPIPPPHPRLSKLAVVSLVFGLWSFATILFLGVIPAVVALICGHVALIKIKHSHQKLRGGLPATIGLIAGYATVILTPFLAVAIAVAIPLIDSSHEQGQERNRLDHASVLFRACEAYARDNANQYPDTWGQLRGRYLSPLELKGLLEGQHDSFWDDAEEEITDLFTDEEESACADDSAFMIIPHERPVLRALEGSVIVIREQAAPDVERIVVVYDNGETTMIANPNRD